MRIDQSHSDIILHVSTEKYESWKELVRLFSEKETFLDAVTSSFYSLDQLISQLFWVVLVKNTTWLRHCLQISHCKSSLLFFWLSSWSHSEVVTLGRQQVTAPVTRRHLLPIQVITQVCRDSSGIRLTWTIHSSMQWREIVTANETVTTEWDVYEPQEQSGLRSCRVKHTARRREKRNMSRTYKEMTDQRGTKKWHGYAAESLSELRVIGTHQDRQPPGWPDHKTCELIYRSV